MRASFVLAAALAACTIPTKEAGTSDVDAGDPHDTRIDDQPADDSNQAAPTFVFSSPGDDPSFLCTLDAADPIDCTSPWTGPALADGSHHFAVAAVVGGEIDPTPAQVTWTIDTVAPDTTIPTGPPSLDDHATPSFQLHASEAGATFLCALDQFNAVDCASPYRPSVATGAHTVTVAAIDRAGNADPTPAQYTWTADTQPPDTRIDSGPGGFSSSTLVIYTFSSPDDPAASFECQLDGGIWNPCTSGAPLLVTVAAHTFSVRARDLAGNVDTTPPTSSFTVDTVAPVVTITTPPPATAGSHVSISFTSDESYTSCDVDGTGYEACTSPADYRLAEGPHTFTVQSYDSAYNRGVATASWTTVCGGAIAAPGMIGQFHLDETGTTQTAINGAGGNNAVLGTSNASETVDPTRISGGRVGGGLRFAATDGDELTWQAGAAAGALTMELWVKSTANGSTDMLAHSANAELYSYSEPGFVRFFFQVMGDDGSFWVTGGTDFTPGVWHLVDGTYDGTVERLYVDGAQVSATAVTRTSLDLSSFRFGENDLFSIDGDVDEIYVGVQALSAAAIADRYCPSP